MDLLDNLIAVELKPYDLIMDTLESRQNEDGITHISQKYIGELTKIQPTTVGKKLKVLQKLGSVKQIAPGKYKFTREYEKTPHFYIKKLMTLIIQEEVSPRDYVTQGKILGLDKPMLHMVNEYIRRILVKLAYVATK